VELDADGIGNRVLPLVVADVEIGARDGDGAVESGGVAFGFDKPLMDTPRAITVVSSEMLDIGAIRSSEDLVKIAPSTYSNFRFGLQGNISIRNQTSDFYFRGMKRIDLIRHLG